jgi:hypothetical protein
MKKEQNKETRIVSCPPEVLALVERFDQNLDSYQSGKYNETQLRQEFLNPLFEALNASVFSFTAEDSDMSAA